MEGSVAERKDGDDEGVGLHYVSVGELERGCVRVGS